jgi:hypothetical protein
MERERERGRGRERERVNLFHNNVVDLAEFVYYAMSPVVKILLNHPKLDSNSDR